MNDTFFENKDCLVYPYSGTTKILKKYLLNKKVNVKGFVDSKQIGDDIFNIKNLDEIKFDYIFVFSPNHFQDIYKLLIKTVSSDKIILVDPDDFASEYLFVSDINTFIQKRNKQENELETYFNNKLSTYILEDEVLLVGIDFIDLNIKYLYLYLKQFTNLKVHLSTNSLRDIEIFKSYNINVVHYDSKEFIDLVLKCKVKIIDHSPVDEFLVKLLKIGKCIQLWHGITIKMLGTQTNYKVLSYDTVLSTSPFVTNYSFSKLYDYKKIIHCGYPRNDVIHFDNIPLINIEDDLLLQMQNDSYRYIVYMPTYRPLGFEKNPINYLELEHFGMNNNIKFIIKMHPFSAEKTRDDLTDYQPIENYEHLIIYPANKDIYPLFKYTDMMIADYSSSYFDYLFTNNPIVFFSYDYEDWSKSADGTMLDYFEYSPGDKCYTFDVLLDKVLKNFERDKFTKNREYILDKMFENKTECASNLIVTKIKGLMSEY